jgi:hypothetical protein
LIFLFRATRNASRYRLSGIRISGARW